MAISRATFLSPPDFHRLEWACRTIHDAFGEPPYLVGSVLTRPDFRDIDLRLILDDDAVKRLCGASGIHGGGNQDAVRLLLNIALSDLITKLAAPPAPIDFQIQSQTEANAEPGRGRNPMGIRHLIRHQNEGA